MNIMERLWAHELRLFKALSVRNRERGGRIIKSLVETVHQFISGSHYIRTLRLFSRKEIIPGFHIAYPVYHGRGLLAIAERRPEFFHGSVSKYQLGCQYLQ